MKGFDEGFKDFAQKNDAMSCTEQIEFVLNVPNDAMEGSIVYRYGNIPVACKNRGNGFMIGLKGKRREFCSPTCRVRYSKEGKAEMEKEGVHGEDSEK